MDVLDDVIRVGRKALKAFWLLLRMFSIAWSQLVDPREATALAAQLQSGVFSGVRGLDPVASAALLRSAEEALRRHAVFPTLVRCTASP